MYEEKIVHLTLEEKAELIWESVKERGYLQMKLNEPNWSEDILVGEVDILIMSIIDSDYEV